MRGQHDAMHWRRVRRRSLSSAILALALGGMWAWSAANSLRRAASWQQGFVRTLPGVQTEFQETLRIMHETATCYVVLALVCLAAIPFFVVRYRRATLRMLQAENRCTRCGYDLRGLTEPRCPECGTPFSTGYDAEVSPKPPGAG